MVGLFIKTGRLCCQSQSICIVDSIFNINHTFFTLLFFVFLFNQTSIAYSRAFVSVFLYVCVHARLIIQYSMNRNVETTTREYYPLNIIIKHSDGDDPLRSLVHKMYLPTGCADFLEWDPTDVSAPVEMDLRVAFADHWQVASADASPLQDSTSSNADYALFLSNGCLEVKEVDGQTLPAQTRYHADGFRRQAIFFKSSIMFSRITDDLVVNSINYVIVSNIASSIQFFAQDGATLAQPNWRCRAFVDTRIHNQAEAMSSGLTNEPLKYGDSGEFEAIWSQEDSNVLSLSRSGGEAAFFGRATKMITGPTADGSDMFVVHSKFELAQKISMQPNTSAYVVAPSYRPFFVTWIVYPVCVVKYSRAKPNRKRTRNDAATDLYMEDLVDVPDSVTAPPAKRLSVASESTESAVSASSVSLPPPSTSVEIVPEPSAIPTSLEAASAPPPAPSGSRTLTLNYEAGADEDSQPAARPKYRIRTAGVRSNV